MKTGPQSQAQKLLRLWKNKQNEALPFAEIIEQAKQEFRLEKRTTINYLNLLVRNGLLEKIVDIRRNTHYKPKDLNVLTKEVLKAWIDTVKNPEVFAHLQYIMENEKF